MGEFPEQRLRVFIFCLQLHMQPLCVMANASKKTELEYPPLWLKCPAWEHCDFLDEYCYRERHVSGVTI